jgi:mono/diheme cytochrome c family protein
MAWPGLDLGKALPMRALLAGFVLALIVVAAGAYAVVASGSISARGDVAPNSLEKWAARTSLRATIAREMPVEPYPYASSEAGIIEGAGLYAAHCSICHGNAEGKPSVIASGFAIKAPQFAKRGVSDDPAGKIYWQIEHGIHWTAMPAFGGRLTEAQIWNVAFFLKNGFEKLPPAADAAWRKPLPEPPAAAAPPQRVSAATKDRAPL